jgi:hypothetical protein
LPWKFPPLLPLKLPPVLPAGWVTVVFLSFQ